MTKQLLPPVSVLAKDSYEEFKSADKVVAVAYFSADDQKSNETFTSVATNSGTIIYSELLATSH